MPWRWRTWICRPPHQVGAAGAVVWRALGGCVAAVDEAEVLAVDDQYGVLYVVATWTAQWADPA